MQKLLIADGSEAMIGALCDVLEDSFQIRYCQDGQTAYAILQSFRPDILIVNLLLPHMDGLTLIQESPYKPPFILALTHFANDPVLLRAAQLGVGYLLVCATPHTVKLRLLDMLYTSPLIPKPSDPDLRTAMHLHMLRFSPHRDGYRQLCVGIPLFRQDPHQYIHNELYPAIAAKSGCKSIRSVEHSIRIAIEEAWSRRDRAIWASYFPELPHRCPTNKVFIARLAELLDEEIPGPTPPR